MKKAVKKFISAILVVVVLISSFSVSELDFAVNASAKEYSGYCDSGFPQKVKWVFNNGKLTISGAGNIKSDYTGWDTFKNQITSVEIGDGVKEIRSNAFRNFTNMKYIIIPKSVKYFSLSVFVGCQSLKNVFYLGDRYSWNSISNNGVVDQRNTNIYYFPNYEKCGQDSYWSFDNRKLTVFGEGGIDNNYTGWNGKKSFVESVEILDGITSIGTSAFSDFGNMKNITIPESVTNIGNVAFSRCAGLTSINIPAGVTRIGGGVFNNCTSLTSITIPDRVTNIDSGAFYNCIGLTSITIPDRVTNIGSSAFYNCTGLANVSIPASVSYIGAQAFLNVQSINYSQDWYNRVMNGRGSPWGALAVNNYAEGYIIYENSLKKKIIRCSPSAKGEIVIPGSVTTIADRAFYECTELTSVTIPNSVTNIEEYTFYGCTGLTSVTIPYNVKNIGMKAFAHCTGLTNVTIPDSVTSIGAGAFSECKGLKSVTISKSVTSIEFNTFYNCTGLTNITIPDSVTSIGETAFSSCIVLSSVTIPDSVKNIGSMAFFGVNNIIYSTKMTATGSKWGAKVANGHIDGNLIYENTSKEKICGFNAELSGELKIPSGVTSIGQRAFWGCTGITNVVFPNSIGTMGTYAFYGCTGLTDLTIPNSLTSIGNGVFSHCTGLTNVTFHDNVISIGNVAFSDCTGLTSITIPGSVKIIENSAFSHCSGLTNIEISEGVENIKTDVFSYCTGLTSVTIPNSVTNIGDDVFSYCTALKSIIFSDGDNGITSISNGMFYNCASLTSIEIPNKVTKIGRTAFYGCTGLTSIKIPDGVTSIGSAAFNGVINVEYSTNMIAKESPWGAKITNGYVDTVNGLVYTDRTMKELVGCSTAATGEITIPSSVETIRDNAFYNCRNIEKITIPLNTNISQINSMAFYGVNNIAYPDLWYKEKMNSTGSPWGAKAVGAYVEDGLYYFDTSKELLLGCSPLLSGPVKIPETVEEVGDLCFNGCNEITTLSFESPKLVFSDTAFMGCEKLESVSSANTYDDITFTTSIYNTEGKEERGILFCNRGSEIDDYIVPEDVKYICANAFAECENVSVSFEKNPEIIRIGKDAFLGSKDYNQKSNWTNGMLILGNYLVAANDEVPTQLELNDNVTLIADSAFSKCTELKKFVGGSSLEYIGSYAFGKTKIKLSEDIDLTKCLDLKSIGEDILYSEDTDNTDKYETVYNGKALLSVSKNERNRFTVKTDTKLIAAGAFKNCKSITEVFLPTSVTEINDETFSGCINLKSINLHDGIKSIGRNAFKDCCSLTSVSIPSSVKNIGDFAFNGCRNVTKYTVSDENRFFADSDGVLYNKDKTVLLQYPCAREHVAVYEVGDSVKICDFAFQYCNNIKKIKIEENVKFGKRNPFVDCSATYVVGDEERNIAYADSGQTLVSVSPGYAGKLELNELVTTIIGSVAKNCSGITSVKIPASVSFIGESAFENCTNLKTVEFTCTKGRINDVLKEIGEFAFCNCPCNAEGGSCNKDILKANDKKVGDYAFHNHNSDDWDNWAIIPYPEFNSLGEKTRSCHECKRTESELLPNLAAFITKPSVEFTKEGLVYGFDVESDNIGEYTQGIEKNEIICDAGRIHTGSKVSILTEYGDIKYSAVIFGDVNGDGWYDGTDAVLVSMIAGGMLTKEQVGEAVYMAADCNHDGTIDESDVDILQQAGLLLANVDQSKSSEELQTDSNYIEYLSLIDQNPTADEPADEPTAETSFFQMFINFIVKFFNYLKLYFAILK